MDRSEELAAPGRTAVMPAPAAMPGVAASPATGMFSSMGNAAAAQLARAPAPQGRAAPGRPPPPPGLPPRAQRTLTGATSAALARAVLARDNGAAAPPAPSAQAPKEGTPEASVEDAKRKAREEIQAQKQAIVDQLMSAIDSLPAAPEIARQPAGDYRDRLQTAAKQWLDTVLAALKQKLQTLAADIANSEVGKSAVQAAKDVAKAIQEDEVLREVVAEIAKILQEVYKKDSATITKKVKVKGGKLGALLKVEDITSGVTKAAAALELVTKSFTAEISFDSSGKISVDLIAAVMADAELAAHLDETGGEISLTMTTKSGKVVVVPAKLRGGKGEVTVPAEVRETMIAAKIDEAAGKVRAKVSAQLAARRYARDRNTGKVELVSEATLRAYATASAAQFGAGIEAKYRTKIIDAAVSAAIQYSDGATRAELKGALSYALDTDWTVYLSGQATTGPKPKDASLGGEVGVKHKSGLTIGVGAMQVGPNGHVVVSPMISIPIPGS